MILSLDRLVILCYSIRTMKETKNINWTSYKRQRAQEADFNAEMARIEKQTFVLQHITSFCIGASVALGLVLVHMIYFG